VWYGNFDIIFISTFPHVFSLHARRVMYHSTKCPCLFDADWCLLSDVVTDSRLQVLAVQPSCKRIKVGDRVYGDIGANTLTATGAKTKELGGYGQCECCNHHHSATARHVSVLP